MYIYQHTFDLSEWRVKQLTFSIENTLTTSGVFLRTVLKLFLARCYKNARNSFKSFDFDVVAECSIILESSHFFDNIITEIRILFLVLFESELKKKSIFNVYKYV